MDFDLTQEQRIFFEQTKKFALNELAEGAQRRASSTEYPRDVARKFSEQGLMGITIPEEKGGIGGSLTDAVLAIQAVAEVCPRSADVVQAGNFGPVRTFSEYASQEQRERFLPRMLSGDSIFSVAMSEPNAGSAVTELATRAKEDGDSYVVNGCKVFGTHSTDADVFLVYVRFGPGTEGIGSILIERGTPGLTVSKPCTFMNGERWSQLHFDDCRVPKSNLLLGAGGFKKQISGFNIERLGNAARSVFVGRFAFNLAKEYAETRQQFGAAIFQNFRDFSGNLQKWMCD